MKPLLSVTAPVSRFVTVTLRLPVEAPPATEMLIVSLVALFHVTELTVIPEPENATVAPLWKPVPFTTIDWLV